jgi:hypothetical protein
MGETDRETYEVRALTPAGTMLRVGPLRSAIDVGLLAYRYLADGRAVRVELHRTCGGRSECFGVVDRQGARWRGRSGRVAKLGQASKF